LSPTYAWRRFYEQAVLETNPSRLPGLIRAAHAAIDERIAELKMNGGPSAEELQALEDALAGLRVLRREANLN
jgi:hypothetical protein